MTHRYVDDDRLRAGQIVLLSLAVLWGIDLIITPDWAVAQSLTIVDRAMPLQVWGALFLLNGIGGLLGEAWMEIGRAKRFHKPKVRAICQARHRWWPSYFAHAGLLAIYVTLGFGQLIALINHHQFYSIRGPAIMWTFAVGHWVFMSRRRHAD